MTDTCASCKYFVAAPSSAGIYAGATHCRAAAPRQVDPKIGYTWPLVQSDEWCGEGADSGTGRSFSSDVNAVPGTGGDGKGYLATSTTSLTIGSSGSKAPVTQLNLAYSAGARVRLTSTGTAAWMEGPVTGYAADGTLTFTADLSSGAGTHTDWNINLAGNPATGSATKGSFTLTASPLTVNDAAVQAGSVIILQPTNNAAGLLYASLGGTGTPAAPYISAKSAGVSFDVTVSASGGGGPAGTETFDYIIVN